MQQLEVRVVLGLPSIQHEGAANRVVALHGSQMMQSALQTVLTE